jgi:two-component system sensor histidine kinase YesM
MKRNYLVIGLDYLFPRKYTGISIKLKLILIYTALLFLIILILRQTNYYFAATAIKNQSIKYSQLIVERINSELGQTINELDRLTQTSLADQQLIQCLLRKNIYQNSDLATLNYIESFATRVLNFRRDIDKILIISRWGEVVSVGTDNYLPIASNVRSMPWYQKFSQNAAMFMVLPPHPKEPGFAYDVFSVIRKIRTFPNYQTVGLVKIDLRAGILDQICQTGDFIHDGIVIFDRDFNPVYQKGSALSSREVAQLAALKKAESGTLLINHQGHKKVVNYRTSDYSGWTVALVVQEKILLKEIKSINTISIVLAAICAGLSLLLAVLISSVVTHSVKQLLTAMKKIEQGDLDSHAILKTQDEFAVLANGFNKMVDRIKVLLQANIDMQVKRKEAEMKVLQGQINPHFLYNTLDGIRMKALLNRDSETAGMIEELSGLLRVNANVNREFVKVAEELEYVQRYIKLQNMRYKYPFQLEIDLPEAIMQLPIPKFIIQPLIENSTGHGLETKKNNRRIRISGYVTDQRVTIEVWDNGVGIESELLAELKRNFAVDEPDDHHRIGLRNVNSRIKLYYGREFGLDIASGIQQGTTVSIFLPLSRNEAKVTTIIAKGVE